MYRYCLLREYQNKEKKTAVSERQVLRQEFRLKCHIQPNFQCKLKLLMNWSIAVIPAFVDGSCLMQES